MFLGCCGLCTSRDQQKWLMCVICDYHIDGGHGRDGGCDVLVSHDKEVRVVVVLLVWEVLRRHGGVDFLRKSL